MCIVYYIITSITKINKIPEPKTNMAENQRPSASLSIYTVSNLVYYLYLCRSVDWTRLCSFVVKNWQSQLSTTAATLTTVWHEIELPYKYNHED